jgi:hypothetical protein
MVKALDTLDTPLVWIASSIMVMGFLFHHSLVPIVEGKQIVDEAYQEEERCDGDTICVFNETFNLFIDTIIRNKEFHIHQFKLL